MSHSIKLLIISFIFALFACDSLSKRYDSGLVTTGKVGEILVVCDQGVWNSDIKKYLDTNLTQFIMPYFPDVTTFELIHRKPERFEGAIKRHRNTLFLKLESSHKGGVKVKYNKVSWAKNQHVVELIAKDYNQLLSFCKTKLMSVHNYFDEYEWKRLLKSNKRISNDKLNDKLNENFKIKVSFPSGAKMVFKKKNFFRIEMPQSSRPIEFVGSGSQDPGTIFSGVMVYQYDYIDSSQMNLTSLLQARDTMLKYNVPHESNGFYMGTQYNKFVYPEINDSKSDSEKVNGKEIRGMFQFKHKSKKNGTGGAFWSFHFIHPKTKKIICISGYVDAPSTTSWTHALREIQAVWKSIQII